MNMDSLSYAGRRARVALALAVGSFILSSFVASSAHAAECATGQHPFESIEAEQCYTVPSEVTAVTITAIGARGEMGDILSEIHGGFGALVSAQVPVTPGQTLYVEVGSSLGFNGGGTGGGEGGHGGGASDVSTCSATASSCPGGVSGLATRILVAGGGGGGGHDGSQVESGIEFLRYGVKGGSGGSAGSSPAAGSSGAGHSGASGGIGGEPGGPNAGGGPGAGGSGPTSSGISGVAGTEGSGGAGGAGYEDEGGGGGGGGGYYGGGGGGGGGYEATNTFGGGGGGGAGSSFIEDSATNGSITTDTTGKPSVTIAPVAAQSGTTSSSASTTERSMPAGSSLPANITDLAESHHTWREGRALAAISRRNGQPPLGTTFSFTLSEEAQVDFAFTAQRTGRMSNGDCVAVTNKNRHKASCKRTVTAGTLIFAAQSGSHKVAFQGRITSSTKLPPGTYTLAIVATNAAGRSSPQHLTFTIVK
jgi:hypothetical protein